MNFEEFKNLIEERKKLLIQGEKTKADEIENKVDPNNLGLKRYFKVKRRRVEKVLKEYFENKGIFLKYDLKMKAKSFDWIFKLPYGETYTIKCSKKDNLGYIDLKCLYSNISSNDDMDLLLENYPELEEGLWKVVLDTNNETKKREIFSLNMEIRKNNQEAEYLNKEKNMVVQLTQELQERKQEVIKSLKEINVEGNTEIKEL